MRSSAIFQIVSTLAALALVTLPTAEALPVRGALGNLGARARAAKRAAHYHATHATAPTVVAEKRFKAPASTEKRTANAKKEMAAAAKQEATSFADSVIPPTPQFKAKAVKRDLPNPKAFLASTSRTTVGDNVAALPEMGPIIIAAAQAIVSAPSSSAAPAVAAVTPDAAAIYQSYIAAMDAPLSSSPVEDVIAATPTFNVAVVVPAAPTSATTVDEAVVYNSYVAAMDAPTTGLWASYTPSASSPVKH